MSSSYSPDNLIYRLEGYYLIPHELLHVLAYRLIGKPCRYTWGDHRVESDAPKTKGERLFVLLLPFVTCWILGTLFHLLWILLALSTLLPPEQYFREAPLWHYLLPITATGFIIYSGTGYRDIRRVWKILFEEQSQQKRDYPHHQPPNHQSGR